MEKRRIVTILPVLTYGSETLSLVEHLEKVLKSTPTNLETVMLGVTYIDRNRSYGLGNKQWLSYSNGD